jgi:hypothetical protein
MNAARIVKKYTKPSKLPEETPPQYANRVMRHKWAWNAAQAPLGRKISEMSQIEKQQTLKTIKELKKKRGLK